MSGGSHNYIYCRIEEDLAGQMEDRELNDLITDIVELAHDLEWYKSADYCREDYLKTKRKFKEKWFKQSREERLKKYIETATEELKKDLLEMIGDDDE